MIIDKIEKLSCYIPISCRDKILSFIKNIPGDISDGEYPILNDSIFAKVQSYPLKATETSKVEAHRRYIDIQSVIKGTERIDVFDCSKLTNIETEYNVENDVLFYSPGEKLCSIAVHERSFTVLFPHEAHRPQMAVGEDTFVKKFVIKVAVELWNT